MILKKKLYAVIAALLFSLTTVGCNNLETTNNDEENLVFYTLTIDGDKVAYPEDSEDVIEIIELTHNFTTTKTSADYTKGYNGEDLAYYLDSVREMFEEANTEEQTREYIETNKLIIEVSNFDIEKCEIFTIDGIDSSIIVMNYISKIIDATDEYCEENQVEKGARYSRTVTLDLAKENDKWKVAEIISVTPRVKVE